MPSSGGSHAEVIEPKSLREEIRAEAEMMANRYEGEIVTEKRESGLETA